jgi:replicative DNA helicase
MNTVTPLRPVDASSEDAFRQAPHNLDAEQALLGAILVNNEASDRVTSFLTAEHFFEPVHARIFEAAASLIRMGKLATPVTLRSYFENDATLKEIGGPAYLARLAASATTIINAEEYGRTIYELSQRRKLIGIGTDIVNEAFDSDVENNAKAMIEKAETTLYSLAEVDKYSARRASLRHFHGLARPRRKAGGTAGL